MRLDQRDGAHASRPGQLADLLNALSAVHLHADLNHSSRSRQHFPHAAGVAGIERHGLFLVHVLARLDRGDEVDRVQVLRRRDQDRVDRLVVEERPVVLERRDAGDDRPHFLEPAGVDVRHSNGFTSGHRRAARRISFPREPPPIRPNRIRSFAPKRLPVAGVAVPAMAALVAPPIIDPSKARRWDMACLLNGGVCSLFKNPQATSSLHSLTRNRCSSCGRIRSGPQ